MQLDTNEIERIMEIIENDAYVASLIRDAAYRHILNAAGFTNPLAARDAFADPTNPFRQNVIPGVGDAVADALNDLITDWRMRSPRNDAHRAMVDVLSVLFDLARIENQRLIGDYVVELIDLDDLNNFIRTEL